MSIQVFQVIFTRQLDTINTGLFELPREYIRMNCLGQNMLLCGVNCSATVWIGGYVVTKPL